MINLTYDSKDAIPEGFASLYTEKDGKFVLTGVDGMKTQQDVDNVQEALKKERGLKKAAEATVASYDGIEAEGLRESMNELAKLRITGGKVDDSKLEGMVEARLKLDKDAWDVKEKRYQDDISASKDANKTLVNGINKGKIKDGLRDAAKDLVNESAMSDVEFHGSLFEMSEDGNVLTRDGIDGVTPGQDPKTWLTEKLQSKTHWQKTSSGGGARGSAGNGGSPSNKPNSIAAEVESQVQFN